MPNYRRYHHPGGMFFFTVNLRDRRSNLLTENFDLFMSIYQKQSEARPFHTHSYVILPDHIHCIWELPDGDSDYATRWRLIKTAFSKAMPKSGEPDIKLRKGERGIWQRRYWEHYIRDEKDFENHMDYIRHNPVKHGYVDHPHDWQYARWHRPV